MFVNPIAFASNSKSIALAPAELPQAPLGLPVSSGEVFVLKKENMHLKPSVESLMKNLKKLLSIRKFDGKVGLEKANLEKNIKATILRIFDAVGDLHK